MAKKRSRSTKRPQKSKARKRRPSSGGSSSPIARIAPMPMPVPVSTSRQDSSSTLMYIFGFGVLAALVVLAYNFFSGGSTPAPNLGNGLGTSTMAVTTTSAPGTSAWSIIGIIVGLLVIVAVLYMLYRYRNQTIDTLETEEEKAARLQAEIDKAKGAAARRSSALSSSVRDDEGEPEVPERP